MKNYLQHLVNVNAIIPGHLEFWDCDDEYIETHIGLILKLSEEYRSRKERTILKHLESYHDAKNIIAKYQKKLGNDFLAKI